MRTSSDIFSPTLPNEILRGGGIAISDWAPNGNAHYTVGSIIFPATQTILGTPVEIDGFYFHFIARFLKTGGVDLNIFLSRDIEITIGGDSYKDVLEWLNKNNYKTFSLKKRDNGTFFTGSFGPDTYTYAGNYVLLNSYEMWADHFELMLYTSHEYWGVLLSESPQVLTTLPMLRDCKIHLRPQTTTLLKIGWNGIYTWESNEESLWVVDSTGELIAQYFIPRGDEKGSVGIELPPGKEYVVHIPGYSFRNFDVSFGESVPYVIETTKLHFTSWLPLNTRFYFKVFKGDRAIFCMKDYARGTIQSPRGVRLTRIEDNAEFSLNVTGKNYFYEFDSLELEYSAEYDQTYKVDFIGEGRAAFWMDGIPSVFSDRPAWYERPNYLNGSSSVTWPDFGNSVGHYPNVGHYMPYVEIPQQWKHFVLDLYSQCANIYTFADSIQRENGIKERERVMRSFMSNECKFERDYTILANTGRVAVIDFVNDPNMEPAMDFWINNMADIGDGKEHYIAAADEPNLNYPTYEDFEEHFIAFATFMKNHPRAEEAGVKIAAVASSRFDRGTSVEDSVYRLGETWLSNIVNKVPELVDAIVWHDWTVRGLLNLRQYSHTVERAYKYSNNGQRRLAIEQTNTAGGSSVSLYDQNSHFAVLWWASVFINCARTGKLDDLMWFPTFDEFTHPKGLIYYEGRPGPEFKLVAYFHQKLNRFLNGKLNKKVHVTPHTHIELDFVGISNESYRLFLAVNKAPRYHQLELVNCDWNMSSTIVEVMTDGNVVTRPTITVQGSSVTITIPPEGVLFMHQNV